MYLAQLANIKAVLTKYADCASQVPLVLEQVYRLLRMHTRKFQPHQGKISCHFCEKGHFNLSLRELSDHSSIGEFVPPSIASGGDGGGVRANQSVLATTQQDVTILEDFARRRPMPGGTRMVFKTHSAYLSSR